MKIVRRSTFVASPWKNGGGITHEAIRHPAGGVEFQWRVSMAQIDASGPFSDFSGYRRVMVLLRGAGLRLSHANGEPNLLQKPGDLVEFDGAIGTRCDLLAGRCVDFNLMTSKSLPAARVGVARVRDGAALTAPPRQTTLVFCVAGRLVLTGRDGKSDVLEEWDLAVVPAGRGGIQGHVTVAPANAVDAGSPSPDAASADSPLPRGQPSDWPLPSAAAGPSLVFWAFLADT
jgi:environmental stress-induced protein Ves